MKRITMSHLRLSTLLTLSTLLLVACGGGGASGAHTAIPASATTQSKGTVTLNIKIPVKALSSSSRQLDYISASTQSMTLAFTQNNATVLSEAIGLTPSTNSNCSTVSGYTNCIVTLPLAAGTYTGTIATYSGPVVSNAATGSVLSQGQNIAVTVVANEMNQVALTLDGVPASMSIAPTTGSSITGTQTAGFTVKATAQSLTIEALDASGNIIVGPGAPTFTAAETGGFTLTQPLNTSPNTMTIAEGTGGSGTLTVTAAPANGGFSCTTAGVVCTASATISGSPHYLFVANSNTLTVYSSTDNVTWTLQETNNNISDGNSLALASDGTLFAANAYSFSSNIYKLASPYTGTPTSITTDINEPIALAVNSSQQLIDLDNNTLNIFTSPWTGTPTQKSLGTNAYFMTLDSNNVSD